MITELILLRPSKNDHRATATLTFPGWQKLSPTDLE